MISALLILYWCLSATCCASEENKKELLMSHVFVNKDTLDQLFKKNDDVNELQGYKGPFKKVSLTPALNPFEVLWIIKDTGFNRLPRELKIRIFKDIFDGLSKVISSRLCIPYKNKVEITYNDLCCLVSTCMRIKKFSDNDYELMFTYNITVPIKDETACAVKKLYHHDEKLVKFYVEDLQKKSIASIYYEEL